MAQYVTARRLMAAAFALLVVVETIAWILAVAAGADVETLVLTGVLGLLSFIVLAPVLLFDARRRHQLRRALRSQWASLRLLIRVQAVGPSPVGARSGAALVKAGRRSGEPSRDEAPEAPTYETATELDDRWVPTTFTVREPGQQRLPASPRVAQGAPLVRLTRVRYHQSIRLATARARLTLLRRADQRSARQVNMSCWAVCAALLLLVPAVLTYQMRARTSWFGGIWAGSGGRVGLVAALALGVAGCVWGLIVTRRGQGGRIGPPMKGEAHAVRSLLAAEQLAVRLALGAPSAQAWDAVALSNHFPVGSAIPTATLEEALELVAQLRGVRWGMRHRLVRWRFKAIAAPLLICILPASVIILLL